MNQVSNSEKIAYMCNANCQTRYGSTASEIDELRKVLESKDYDVRTRGCLSVCNEIGEPSEELRSRAIVNVVLVDEGREKHAVAGLKEDGSIGMMPVQVSN